MVMLKPKYPFTGIKTPLYNVSRIAVAVDFDQKSVVISFINLSFNCDIGCALAPPGTLATSVVVS